MSTISNPRITPEQVTPYRPEGYVLPKVTVFEECKFQRLFDHFEKKLAECPKNERPAAMDTPHFADHKLLEWSLAPEVIEARRTKGI